MNDTPRTDAAERAAMDDTGAIARMEPIWETMMALERENNMLIGRIAELMNSHQELVDHNAMVQKARDSFDRQAEESRQEIAKLKEQLAESMRRHRNAEREAERNMRALRISLQRLQT